MLSGWYHKLSDAYGWNTYADSVCSSLSAPNLANMSSPFK